MLVDPRFALDENFLLGFEWEILEDEFIHLIIRVSVQQQLPKQELQNLMIRSLLRSELILWTKIRWIFLWARDVRSPSALSQKSTDSQRELKSAYKAEFNLFRHGIVRLGRDENVFEWWSNNKFRFPLIAEGAKRFLSVPATSVSSERTFSMAGLLYANTLRNRLGAKMAENLMLIKASLKKTMLAPSVEPDDDELDNKEEIEENVLLQQQID
uniref:HAT C-terminal dimerisation domain-containing protein n=1 Tax=Globodera rostochiensis TaxID=31243 RepID=A0A914H6L0_GLORO